MSVLLSGLAAKKETRSIDCSVTANSITSYPEPRITTLIILAQTIKVLLTKTKNLMLTLMVA